MFTHTHKSYPFISPAISCSNIDNNLIIQNVENAEIMFASQFECHFHRGRRKGSNKLSVKLFMPFSRFANFSFPNQLWTFIDGHLLANWIR